MTKFFEEYHETCGKSVPQVAKVCPIKKQMPGYLQDDMQRVSRQMPSNKQARALVSHLVGSSFRSCHLALDDKTRRTQQGRSVVGEKGMRPVCRTQWVLELWPAAWEMGSAAASREGSSDTVR